MTEEKAINDGYSVCFNAWALDAKIKNELPLLMIISSLSAKSGVCFASNEYFAELFGCSEYSISRKISLLSKEGYIKINYQRRGAEVTKREIRLPKIATDDCQKTQPTIAKKRKDNNTSINNTSINNINPLYPLMDDFEEFWKEYPKQRAGSKDKARSAYQRIINQKKATTDVLLQACRIYAGSDEVARGFAKGCAAWLNDDRYEQWKEGEIKPAKKSKRSISEINRQVAEDFLRRHSC